MGAVQLLSEFDERFEHYVELYIDLLLLVQYNISDVQCGTARTCKICGASTGRSSGGIDAEKSSAGPGGT